MNNAEKAAAWERCGDGDYKVYVGPRPLPYTVIGPGGEVVGCTSTLWGAKRAIRKHREKGTPPKTWERPIVHTEPASGVCE